MNDTRSQVERKLGWVTLALLAGGCLLVMRPFLSALLWAGILSYSIWPLYGRLVGWLGGRQTLAALLVALGMMGVVLLPVVLVGATLRGNVKDLTAATQRWLDDGLPAPPAWLARVPVVGKPAAESWRNLVADSAKLLAEARRLIEPAGAWLVKTGLALGTGLLELALSILITFLLLRNGPAVAQRLTAGIERIAGERGRHLLGVAGSTVRGVVYGILGTALVQGVMAGLGLLVAGVPGPGLLALLVFFLSVVPAGPFLVMLPAALWLFHQGATGWGVFVLIWGVAVGTVDNFVRPWLISHGSDMPFILILFGVLGGALTFGLVGVFIGPTLLAVGHRIVEEWTVGRTLDSTPSARPLAPLPSP